MRYVRLGINVQLSIVVSLAVLFSLGMMSIATYLSNEKVLLDLSRTKLHTAAQLKGVQLTQAAYSIYTQVFLLATNNNLMDLLNQYYETGTISNGTATDFKMAVSSTEDVYATSIYSSGYATLLSDLTFDPYVNFTNFTFPAELYPLESSPNITDLSRQLFTSNILVGPVDYRGSLYLSLTRRLTNFYSGQRELGNVSAPTVGTTVGYMTTILSTQSLQEVLSDDSGLPSSGNIGVVSMQNSTNDLSPNASVITANLLFPNSLCVDCFNKTIYLPAELQNAFLNDGSSGVIIDLHSPQYTYGSNWKDMSIGYISLDMLNQVWLLFVTQEHYSVWEPLYNLRNVLVITVFSVGAAMCLITLVLSRWAVKPIVKLQRATEIIDDGIYRGHHSKQDQSSRDRIRGLLRRMRGSSGSTDFDDSKNEDIEESSFKIPQKVKVRRFIIDELTMITQTFNEMTDALRVQYATLEERVIERTMEIGRAKLLAESANEAKSLFIANISHELRTPLNGILGMTAVSLEEQDPAKIRYGLKVIFKSGELLLHLLTDLLSFSKNDIFGREIEIKDFNIDEIIAQLNAIFTEQAKRNQINFAIELSNPELRNRVIAGDINRILQIIINLVSNALKFTSANGRVTVIFSSEDIEHKRLDRIEDVSHAQEAPSSFSKGKNSLSGEGTQTANITKCENSPEVHASGSHLTLRENSLNSEKEKYGTTDSEGTLDDEEPTSILNVEVQDTGQGIATHLQDKVFEAFVQGDLGFSQKKVGAGLGLHICKDLVQKMGGTISLKSVVGKGSSFTVRIPVHCSIQTHARSELEAASDSPSNKDFSLPETENPDSISPLDVHQVKGCHVLVAEDNKVNQVVMTRMLRLEGIEDVVIAVDGRDAVEKVKESMNNDTQFDVVFMDVQMPHLDGLQATAVIRKELGYTGPIVAVSAFADESNIEDCKAAGMNRFLAKPLRRNLLHQLLVEVFDGNLKSNGFEPPKPERQPLKRKGSSMSTREAGERTAGAKA